MYLRGAGANSEIARTFFHEELDSFMSEAKLTSAARMYRDNIIITESEGNNTDADRVTAAKTADKMLDIRGVEASFALVKVEGKVLISARSKGTINVQLILEKMGGGGHFDAAAAALGGVDMRSAKHHLTNAIDEYFKENP
jgi:c-di-AMP phosphodiesterase-like protein